VKKFMAFSLRSARNRASSERSSEESAALADSGRHLRRGRIFLLIALLGSVSGMPWLRIVHADSLPQVQLNADSIAPRPIEELTGRNVTRDYANAWRDLGQALDKSEPKMLDAFFTGFAKEALLKKISDQKKTGVHIRYIDHGHQVKAFFYAPDGGEMQLLDKAQLEIQVLDGGNVIYRENSTQQYLVLMTPGADRWFVRSLEAVPSSSLQ
jgi:hypothetical protein